MSQAIRFSVLRGVCQLPAYVAKERGFFRERGLEVELTVEPTAWMVPRKLNGGETDFALMPWTRVAAATQDDVPLVLLAGSGQEEAAIVVRKGLAPEDVRSVVIPQRGGMKDLTAMELVNRLNWAHVDQLRQPSGDGAIIAFFAEGADAASMVEPYATMFEELGMGEIAARTGDLWPGAPGCSLTTTRRLCHERAALATAFVEAFVDGERFVREQPRESAAIGSRYIGVHPRFIEKALTRNRPDVNALRSRDAMRSVLELMHRLGYVQRIPEDYVDLGFLDRALARAR